MTPGRARVTRAASPTTNDLVAQFDPSISVALELGVPAVLVDRAVLMLSRSRSIERSQRFLRVFVQLATDKRIESYRYDFVELLETDEERVAALDLVKAALAKAKHPRDVETLTIQKFRLADASPFDDDVVQFVRHGMDDALAERHGGFQSRKKHFNYHDAREALVDVKRTFDLCGKRFFLDRGTLLGAVREGGFIASDYDIDLGVFGDEVTLDEIKVMFADSSFTLTQDFEYKVGIESAAGITVDFFLTTRERGYFLSKGFRSVHNWYFSPFNLVAYPFLGETFLIPDTFEKHLDENYGNWRHAAIFYDLSYNEPCVAYGKSAAALNYLSRRFCRALDQGNKYYAEAPTAGLRDTFDFDYSDWFASHQLGDVTPVQPNRRPVHPILIIDKFDEYTHRQRRLIESALSITADVNLIALVDHDGAQDGLTVAAAIDRITRTSSLDSADESALDALLVREPQAIIVTPSVAGELSACFVQKLRHRGCVLVVFDDASVALTLDEHGLVTVRSD